jgi:DNA mismatch repair protein MutL
MHHAISRRRTPWLYAARAQVHENYIIAQTETGIVIVEDTPPMNGWFGEKLKTCDGKRVVAQALLIPEIIEVVHGDGAIVGCGR